MTVHPHNKKAESKQEVAIPSRQAPQVTSVVPLLDTQQFEHMQRIASLMGDMTLIPAGLIVSGDPKKTAANCFLLVNQALKWEMDPFAVAQMVSVIHGRLCYEGKLIHAVIEKELKIRLKYDLSGEKGSELRSVTVSGKFPDEDEPRTIEGTVSDWKLIRNRRDGGGDTSAWTPKSYDSMLCYRGAREWARRFAPGILLGVYAKDEMIDLDPSEFGEIEESPPEAPKDVPISVESDTAETQSDAEVAPEIVEETPAEEVVQSGGESDETRPDVTEERDKSDPGEIPEFLRRDSKMKKKPEAEDAVEVEPEEPPEEEEDDEPPAAPEMPEEAEQPELDKQPADVILDAADIDLRACKTPADVKKVQSQYAAQIKSMLQPDQKEFNLMVTQALERTAKKK